MKLSLALPASARTSITGHIPGLRRSRRFRVAVLAMAALGVLAFTFGGGGLAYKAGFGRDVINAATYVAGIPSDLARQVRALSAPDFPTITIDMGLAELDRVRTRHEEAFARNMLLASEDDFVDATLSYEGATYPVKMRLAGDFNDHRDTEKWSYRIDLKGEGRPFGMEVFTIRHPKTRNYIKEFGWHLNLLRDGILATRYDFVNVIFNGKDIGTHAIEEHYKHELLESQGRRPGVIIAMDETPGWENLLLFPKAHDNIGSLLPQGALGATAVIKVYNSATVDRDPVLAQQARAAVELMNGLQTRELRPRDVFDIEKTATWLAISELWDSAHGVRWANPRFYFNPVTSRMEPIGYDGGANTFSIPTYPRLDVLTPDRAWPFVDPRTAIYSIVPRALLDDPVLAGAFIAELRRISSPEYISNLRDELGPEIEETLRSLHKEFPGVESPWAIIEQRARFIRSAVEPPLLLAAYGSGVTSPSQPPVIEVSVANVTLAPVEILGFTVGNGRSVPGQPETNASSDLPRVLPGKPVDEPLQFTRFVVPLEPAEVAAGPPQVSVTARIYGGTSQITSNVNVRLGTSADVEGRPAAPSLSEVLAQHSFLEAQETIGGTLLVIPAGEWAVEGDLVLPSDTALQIGPGASLRFERGAVLVVNGPTFFQGASDGLILLEPAGESWGGIVVLAEGRPSNWSNVIVRDTEGISRGGWLTTGGVTFYEGPILMRDVVFDGSEAEDALNIIGADLDLARIQIMDTRSDALDADFVTGRIAQSSFINIGGDALDFSGSDVEIGDIVAQQVADKGISVGEHTLLTATSVVLSDVSIGVASKDSSEFIGEGIQIVGATKVGLAAYQKKPEYGPGKLTATAVEFVDTEQHALAQTNSTIRVNGASIATTDIDVAALYEAAILGN